VYGKTPEDVIFSKELHDLQLQHVGRFFIHSVLAAKVEHALFGRIEKSTVNYVMNNKHKELEFDKFYLCGPDNDRSSYWCFERENVKESAIKFELFIVFT
jgi:ring-1,2-phenylacetyl-CoA epoxidase subunit PaaE